MKTKILEYCRNSSFPTIALSIILASGFLVGTSAEQCGSQVNFTTSCPDGYCCSNYGWCGDTSEYCDPDKCQDQCPIPTPPPPPPPPLAPAPPGAADITEIISEDMFEEMLKHRRSAPGSNCVGEFYTYDAFVRAARSFPEFGNTGDLDTRKREIAAFFGQTSHETTGGAGDWNPPDGPYAWGYCYIREINCQQYCTSTQCLCVSGNNYCGRGPIQLTGNCNYAFAGSALGANLTYFPELLETDVLLSFQAAIWFWMTPQDNKPSCHSVIIGEWVPNQNDINANRVPGYGVITNIINGGLECGLGEPTDKRVVDRIGFYERYCEMFGVTPGDNLDCNYQINFGVMLRSDH